MLADILFQSDDAIQIDSLQIEARLISLAIHSSQSVHCPDCGQSGSRVHSHYVRKFADVPWVGIAVRFFFNVRRLFCDNPACRRRTFTEQVPSLVAPFAQRTSRLAAIQRMLGFALGGEAGARATQGLGLATSPDTLLRLVRNAPENNTVTPRVLGVDDWAIRKGRDYGTILIDVERSRPVDLLPDRTIETLKNWLQKHPGIEVITRDRASAYADAAKVGAPQAVQVADRFHLLLNLREALERFFDRHQAELRKVKMVKQLREAPIAAKPRGKSATLLLAELSEAREQSRLARFAEVQVLKTQGQSRAAIARQLHMSVNTAKRYIHADEFPIRTYTPHPVSKTAQFRVYLRDRWQAGCHSPRHLWNELRGLGFEGSESSVRRWVARAQASKTIEPARTDSSVTVTLPTKERVLSSRQAAWLLLKPLDDLKDSEKDWWTQFQSMCSPAIVARDLAQQFIHMVKKQGPADLVGWMVLAQGSGLVDFRNYAEGLQRDFAAVSAALTLPWSNGATEGHVHRLKMLKRQMYGRAKFDLLRRRVLAGY